MEERTRGIFQIHLLWFLEKFVTWSEIKVSHFTALASAAGIKLQLETIWWLLNFIHAGLIFDDRPTRNVHPASDPLFSLSRDYPHGIIAKCYIQSHINHSLSLGSWEPLQGISHSAPWWWAGELLSGNTSFRRHSIPTLGSLVYSGCCSSLDAKNIHPNNAQMQHPWIQLREPSSHHISVIPSSFFSPPVMLKSLRRIYTQLSLNILWPRTSNSLPEGLLT